jgi:hypothetical protein
VLEREGIRGRPPRRFLSRHVSPDWLRVGLREASNVTQLYNEMQHAGPMPDVPLIILCSMTTDAFREAVSSSGKLYR